MIATHLACSRCLLQILKEQTHCSCQNVNFYCPYPTLFTLPMAVNSCCPPEVPFLPHFYIFFILLNLFEYQLLRNQHHSLTTMLHSQWPSTLSFFFYFSLLFHHILVYFAFLIQCKTIASYFPGLS